MPDSTQSSDGVITRPSSKSVAQTIDGQRRQNQTVRALPSVQDNTVSSLKLADGYQVTLYAYRGRQGWRETRWHRIAPIAHQAGKELPCVRHGVAWRDRGAHADKGSGPGRAGAGAAG